MIQVDRLGKRYALGRRAQSYRTLRESLLGALRAPWGLFGRSEKSEEEELLWALKDVGFEVRRGEKLGIIGHNGAGKSTLLKILSRITEPTEGSVNLYGRVGSLLEVGTGFHAELTGRENIFLSGTMLGMKRAEIQKKFDSIVAFAEVDRFLDTPVKRYSSGMYVRLGFAVAAHLEPEILIVDEVLAVGDAAFQKKCLGRMENIAREGRTILFVSHNMGAIQGLCGRVLLMSKGRVAGDGEPGAIIRQYVEGLRSGFDIAASVATGDLEVTRVVFRNGEGEPTTTFDFGDLLTVEVHFHARRRVERPHFWIAVASQHGSLFASNMLLDGRCPPYLEGEGTLCCTFRGVSLLPQIYTLTMGVRAADGVTALIHSVEIGVITVTGTAATLGLPAETADSFLSTSSPFFVPYEWRHPDGSVVTVDMKATTQEPR